MPSSPLPLGEGLGVRAFGRPERRAAPSKPIRSPLPSLFRNLTYLL